MKLKDFYLAVGPTLFSGNPLGAGSTTPLIVITIVPLPAFDFTVIDPDKEFHAVLKDIKKGEL